MDVCHYRLGPTSRSRSCPRVCRAFRGLTQRSSSTPTKTVPTEPTGALFRALRSVNVEPNLAYEAAEENRRQAGENVIAAIGAQIAVLGAKIDAQGAKINAQAARIEDLRRVIWRVIWPLIILLAAPIFGLLYKAVTG